MGGPTRRPGVLAMPFQWAGRGREALQAGQEANSVGQEALSNGRKPSWWVGRPSQWDRSGPESLSIAREWKVVSPRGPGWLGGPPGGPGGVRRPSQRERRGRKPSRWDGWGQEALPEGRGGLECTARGLGQSGGSPGEKGVGRPSLRAEGGRDILPKD